MIAIWITFTMVSCYFAVDTWDACCGWKKGAHSLCCMGVGFSILTWIAYFFG